MPKGNIGNEKQTILHLIFSLHSVWGHRAFPPLIGSSDQGRAHSVSFSSMWRTSYQEAMMQNWDESWPFNFLIVLTVIGLLFCGFHWLQTFSSAFAGYMNVHMSVLHFKALDTGMLVWSCLHHLSFYCLLRCVQSFILTSDYFDSLICYDAPLLWSNR